MTAVILTAEQAAQVLAGVREFVVPGNITDGAVTLWKWDEGKPVRHPWRIVAPKQWADADGPCETCGGTRRVDGNDKGTPFGFPYGWSCRNPDCLDGRKRVELYAPHYRSGEAVPTVPVPVAWATVKVTPHDNGCDFVVVLSDVELT